MSEKNKNKNAYLFDAGQFLLLLFSSAQDKHRVNGHLGHENMDRGCDVGIDFLHFEQNTPRLGTPGRPLQFVESMLSRRWPRRHSSWGSLTVKDKTIILRVISWGMCFRASEEYSTQKSPLHHQNQPTTHQINGKIVGKYLSRAPFALMLFLSVSPNVVLRWSRLS